MKSKVYVFHTDAGHGWLAVKRKELIDLNILDKVSHCSYEKGQTVYLEEDCDAPLFVKALEAKGIELKYKEGASVDRSPIRSYDMFKMVCKQ